MKTEITDKRTRNGKVFNLGGRKRRIETSLQSPIHVPSDPSAYKIGDPFSWEDIDTGFDDDTQTGEYNLRNHWMRLKVAQSKVGWRYQSRFTGGYVEIELMQLNGKKLPNNIDPPTLVDGNWQWTNVVSGLDIYLEVSAGRVRAQKNIRTAQAPKQFTWKVTESDPGTINIQYDTAGIDNHDRSNPLRTGTGPGRSRRTIDMLAPVLVDEGAGVTRFTEEWSGQVINRDAQRIPFLTNDVSYPVLIDADIDEDITADGDDGHCYEAGGPITWYDSYAAGSKTLMYALTVSGHGFYPSWRFQTIPTIASGDTVDTATLSVDFLSHGINGSGAEPAATVSGVDIDDSVAWSDTVNTRTGTTKTTANTAFPAWGDGAATGIQNITVTSIVQEIIDRGGWSANNDMSFVCDFDITNTSGNYTYIGDAAGVGTVAHLAIDFTVAGGSIIPQIMHHRQQMQ